jgi:hypothetical protein
MIYIIAEYITKKFYKRIIIRPLLRRLFFAKGLCRRLPSKQAAPVSMIEREPARPVCWAGAYICRIDYDCMIICACQIIEYLVAGNCSLPGEMVK